MIRIAVDDLAFVAADAIVRPATSTLEPTTRSLQHLERVGGPTFARAIAVHQELAVGAAVVTASGDLSADLVIHAIIRSASEPVTEHGVRRALTSALARALDWKLVHVAIPPVGTGAGNLAREVAAHVLWSVLRETREQRFPERVTIVVDSTEDEQIFAAFRNGDGS